jgi:hypothetical protein
LAKDFVGRGEETAGHIEDALRLSPRDTAVYLWRSFNGSVKVFLAKDEEAVGELRRSIEANRNFRPRISTSWSPWRNWVALMKRCAARSERGAFHRSHVHHPPLSWQRAKRQSDLYELAASDLLKGDCAGAVSLGWRCASGATGGVKNAACGKDWSIEGRYVEYCSCDMGCPCESMAPASGGDTRRLAGLSALDADYASLVVVTQSGVVDDRVAHGPAINGGLTTHRKTPPTPATPEGHRRASSAAREERGGRRRRIRRRLTGSRPPIVDAGRPAPPLPALAHTARTKPLEEERGGRGQARTMFSAACMARGGSAPSMPTHTGHRRRAERALPEGRRAS